QYNKITGTKDAPKTVAGHGDFVEWAYYHYGRFSFGTPGWWVPKPGTDAARGGAERGAEGTIDDPVANYLQWATSKGITNTFADWKPIQHVDFPDKQVEVGGLHPFVLHNPPYDFVGDVVAAHTDFVVALAHQAPRIDLVNVRTEKVDNQLTRITLQVFNTGHLPTLTAPGEQSYFLKHIAVKVSTSGNQSVVSGRPAQTIGQIPGRGYHELSWLIQGTGSVTIEAGSPHTGSKSVNVSL